jgi:hypothetical protein
MFNRTLADSVRQNLIWAHHTALRRDNWIAREDVIVHVGDRLHTSKII